MTRWRLIRPMLMLGLVWAVLARAEPAPPQAAEVKAAVIYNLLLFVTWPQDALNSSATPFDLCLLEDDALASALRQMNGRTVHDHPLKVRVVSPTPEEMASCNAVMAGVGQNATLPRLALLSKRRPILVLSDGTSSTERGAMIGITSEGGRISFDIHVGALKEARLAPSSKLLRLARRLID